jgi:uncharacterized metal-binding protein YceD (DUF177 family)
MCSLDTFKIDLKGLKEGNTLLDFHLDNDYFKAIEASEMEQGDLNVTLSISKTDSFFELLFHISGIVHIPCDLCLDDMEQPIETENRLMVKFGEDYSEEDDLVTIAENEGILDVSWFIYEFIELSIPIKHVHAPGKCNLAMMKVLEEHSVTRSDVANDKDSIDPRWAALLKMKDLKE